MDRMNTTKKALEVSPEELAKLGGGDWAYIREIGDAEARQLIGRQAELAPGTRLFCLYDAEGNAVSISGTREDAVGSAFEHELLPMSVH
jgi:hypothetical protein